MFYGGLTVGLFVGCFVGVFFMCLFQVAKKGKPEK